MDECARAQAQMCGGWVGGYVHGWAVGWGRCVKVVVGRGRDWAWVELLTSMGEWRDGRLCVCACVCVCVSVCVRACMHGVL